MSDVAVVTTLGRAKDLTGKRFGRYTVVAFHEKIRGIARWLCHCDCGNDKVVWGNALPNGHVVSCGCYHKEEASATAKSKAANLVGQKFGRLIVIERAGSQKAGRRALWLCKCDCGNITTVPTIHLRNGNTKSCGCIQKETMHKIRWREDLSMEERALGRDRNLLPGVSKWSRTVCKRDGYTCQSCGVKHNPKIGQLAAHHKNCWRDFSEQRLVVENGVTCCKPCHKEFHDTYGYVGSTEQQWMEFMTKRRAAS